MFSKSSLLLSAVTFLQTFTMAAPATIEARDYHACTDSSPYYLRATSGAFPARFAQVAGPLNESGGYSVLLKGKLIKDATMFHGHFVSSTNITELGWNARTIQRVANAVVYTEQEYSPVLFYTHAQLVHNKNTIASCEFTTMPLLQCNTSRYTTFFEDSEFNLYTGTATGNAGGSLSKVTLEPVCRGADS